MSEWEVTRHYISDVMLPMPKVVMWTRNINFMISWLESYVEAVDLGVVNPDFRP